VDKFSTFQKRIRCCSNPDRLNHTGNATAQTPDTLNPPHYKLPGDLEVIQVTRHLNLNRGSAVGYVLRAGRKNLVEGQEVEDLKKAIWHLEDEIQRLTGIGSHAR
jgi:hypothetical protein